MNKVKFDESDGLKQVVDKLAQASEDSKKRRQEGKATDAEDDDIVEAVTELLEELTELVEVNSANSKNLCHMGGMATLLELMVAHDEEQVRKSASRVFGTITSNNAKI